jgi:CxxC motif-containing protein
MREMTCIVCPNGCSLQIDEKTMTVTGNRCPRGAVYAISELTNPSRSVCSSVRTSLKEYPVVSVRTSKDVPKAMIFSVMKALEKATISSYLPLGSTVIKNVAGTGADIITTTDMKKGEQKHV